jgi:U4/U6.U5 tri-snRNP-associated protein 1
VLENVNILDDTKAKENVEKKKAKPVYTAYDDDEFDEHGNPRTERSILSHYDEEIEVSAWAVC